MSVSAAETRKSPDEAPLTPALTFAFAIAMRSPLPRPYLPEQDHRWISVGTRVFNAPRGQSRRGSRSHPLTDVLPFGCELVEADGQGGHLGGPACVPGELELPVHRLPFGVLGGRTELDHAIGHGLPHW